MSNYETTYQVITPSGVFEAVWGEDPLPIEYRGNDAAILHFKNFLSLDSVSGFHGILLNADTLQPDELYLFCQPTGRGITVMPPLDDLLDYERDELNQHYSEPVLDSVEDSSMQVSGIEKLKLVKELSGIRSSITGTISGIEKLKLVKRIGQIRVLLGGHAANEETNDTDLVPDGKDNEVKTAKGTKIVTGFMVIEASKLIVSHDEQGNANPDYPQEMQPRDRARDTSQAQIARIAKNLDPDMLGRTRVAYQGAPIIGKDGVVESGNGRAMAITLAYKLGKADEYRAWLLDIADMYGLNPDKIEHMKRPVLVRVRKTEVDRAQFAIEANQSDMLAMTATEKAKSDAARLTDAIVSKLSIEGDLTAASNRDFIMAFLQSLGDDETAGLLTTSGQPTKQLYDRAQAAVFAKAYNDDRLLELMADAEKPEIANIIKSLNQAAQPFITARNISEHATHATTQKIGDAIDVSLDQQAVDAIIKATEMLKQAKDTGMPIEELIKQSDLFGDVDPVVAQMALFIKDNNRSSARMGAAFVAMAEFVVKELESRQNASLFEDDAPIDMVDVLKAANAQLKKQYGEDVKAIGGTGGFIDLFTETRGQKADREAFLAGKDSPIELTGKELGDFPDTKEGKKALRAVAEKLFEDILDSKENWAPCPPLGGKVMLRPVGVKKVISFSADIRKLKIIPKLKELIKSSHKVGTKPNYDQKNSPNIINYHTLRSEVTLAGDKLAVRFVIGEDDKGMYHYDHSIVPIELIFDSVNKNGFAETNPSILMGGIQEFTYNRSVIPEPSCLLPTKPLDGHQDDINICLSTEIVNDKQVLDSINPSRMVFNLFIEGEDPEIVEDDDSLLDLQQVDPIAIANITASSVSEAIKQKAIKYLQENPASHEIPVIAKKSMAAIMENIKTALFAEIKALSPLFEQEGYTYLKDGDGWMEIDANDSTLKIGVSQQGRMFFVSTDGDTRTSLFDSTSTIEELRQLGFSLPFDLDVKAFVANVIKPVVDEFLNNKEPENEPETESESVPIPSDSDVVIAPESEYSNEVDNQAEEQINETEAVEDFEPEITDNNELGDLDPNSPNYRYRDTGYISGSRKEDAALMIRNAGKNGLMLRATDIDWDEIEKNPREAKTLITKSNLFGAVDWEAAKTNGMTPAAGFLIDRVYASIAKEPSDSSAFRKDYALGLETLRDRLEKLKTPEEVAAALAEIKDEMLGVMMTAKDSEEYQQAHAKYSEINDIRNSANKVKDEVYSAYAQANGQLNSAKYEQEKRVRRGWKPDSDIEQRITDLTVAQKKASEAYDAFNMQHPEILSKRRELENGFISHDSDLDYACRLARKELTDIKQRVQYENMLNNPCTRAWMSMGDKFTAVLNYRSYKGSDAFSRHVTTAKSGNIQDWSWATKDARTISVKESTKQQVKFQLKVANNIERIGGKQISAESTLKLKEMMGLRDVQSGNWVLNDPASAAFHVQKCAEAFSDLGDIIGIDMSNIALGGNLAIAFGARGKGSAGGGAARAHYEPVQRVINLTKMGGGGCLAHEWLHALDNVVSEIHTGKKSGAGDFVSENPLLLPEGKMQQAIMRLRSEMLEGNNPILKTIEYTAQDLKSGKYNFDNRPYGFALNIKNAGNLEAAIDVINQQYRGRTDKKTLKSKDGWIKITAAYYDDKLEGGEVKIKTGNYASSFFIRAVELDAGVQNKYWSKTLEMFARAFQSYTEDKLADQGRKNDYLSCFADNKHYKDPLFGDTFPYPEGEERILINAAFDSFFSSLKDSGTLQETLDSIFNNWTCA